ncbi:MAG: tetratricopeptide repeat protein, partial [Nitrospinae bacterium]|nr:tetratricopeptide repeat protein [Nitrospinota bacterium]
FKRELAIHEKALGPDHQKLAAILDNLAELYIKMGRDDEAKRLLERAEQIRAVQ